MSHTGSCHCGKLTNEVDGSFDTLMECNCSRCSRKGFDGVDLSAVPRQPVDGKSL